MELDDEEIQMSGSVSKQAGDLLDRVIANSKQELSSAELGRQLSLAGVGELFNGLKGETKEYVARNIYRIWLMKKLTDDITRKDEEKMRGIEEMKRTLAAGQEHIDKRTNYQPDAVRALVNLAASDDHGTGVRRAEEIDFYIVDHMNGLRISGGLYTDYYPLIPLSPEGPQLRDEVYTYLVTERHNSVGDVQGVGNALSGSVGDLVNMPSG